MVNCEEGCIYYNAVSKSCMKDISLHDEKGNCVDRIEKGMTSFSNPYDDSNWDGE